MDATCTIQNSIHVFRLVRQYVSRILGTYHPPDSAFSFSFFVVNYPNKLNGQSTKK